MHNLQMAEWILNLVTTPDRAASTVGDLAENSRRFWADVLRTAGSMVWSDVVRDRKQMMFLALRGFAFEIGVGILLVLALGIAFGLVVAICIFAGWQPPHFNPDSIGWMAMPIVFPLLTGRMLARWAPGREIAAGLAFLILNLSLAVVIGIGARLYFGGGDSPAQALLSFAGYLLILVGAAWGRQCRLNQAKKSL